MSNQHTTSCPICHSTDIIRFFELNQVPTHCNLLYPSRAEAIAVQRGDIQLGFCRSGGHIFNSAFDPELMQYTQRYENSLHFSPRFQRYAAELVEDLTRRYDLHKRVIIDVGCGKGDFLRMICAQGDNRGIGFDPSFVPDACETEQITFIQDFYSEKYSDYSADLITCRHVLEHISRPEVFMDTIRRSIKDPSRTVVFFEVPNVSHTLLDMGVWDIIYEHCSYFTEHSLAHLFERTGFQVLNVGSTYAGQFLTIEAVACDKPHDHPSPQATMSLAALERLTQAFQKKYRQKVSYWTDVIGDLAAQRKRAVVWGGGSKGVTFLNVVPSQNVIEYVVDINPRKQGMYVAGTGQEIVSVDFLTEYQPDVVLVMNEIYAEEIYHTLCDRRIQAKLLIV